MTIEPRRSDAVIGARLTVEGGKMGKLTDTGIPSGTRVAVQDLFFNVPARLKFLKSDMTERRHIDALVTRYALAYPEVRWQLVVEGKETAADGR